MFDVTKPRYMILPIQADVTMYDIKRHFPTDSWHECEFWLSLNLDYQIEVYEYNGKIVTLTRCYGEYHG